MPIHYGIVVPKSHLSTNLNRTIRAEAMSVALSCNSQLHNTKATCEPNAILFDDQWIIERSGSHYYIVWWQGETGQSQGMLREPFSCQHYELQSQRVQALVNFLFRMLLSERPMNQGKLMAGGPKTLYHHRLRMTHFFIYNEVMVPKHFSSFTPHALNRGFNQNGQKQFFQNNNPKCTEYSHPRCAQVFIILENLELRDGRRERGNMPGSTT